MNAGAGKTGCLPMQFNPLFAGKLVDGIAGRLFLVSQYD